RGVHHSPGLREYHFHVGPRARSRGRHPENTRFHSCGDSRDGVGRSDRHRSGRGRYRLRAGRPVMQCSSASRSRLHPGHKAARSDATHRLFESRGRAPDRPGERAAAGFQRVPDAHTRFDTSHWIAIMAIPIVYNLRNLVVRKTTTLMTSLGIALTVAVLVADVALLRGLRSVFERSGNPLHILVLRKGSRSELTSAVTREAYRDLLYTLGIATSQSGEPMASLGMVTVVNLPKSGD